MRRSLDQVEVGLDLSAGSFRSVLEEDQGAGSGVGVLAVPEDVGYSRDVMLDSERATRVLTYLEKYEYASIEYVAITLLWHTMMRTGGVYALDVEDYHPKERYLEVRHRPESGKPIKNKESGERLVALSEQICELLDDWIAHRRPDVTDDYGRNPLIASRQGRSSKSTLRKYVYTLTRPC